MKNAHLIIASALSVFAVSAILGCDTVDLAPAPIAPPEPLNGLDGSWIVSITSARGDDGQPILFADFLIRISGGRIVRFEDIEDDSLVFFVDNAAHAYPRSECNATYIASSSLMQSGNHIVATIIATVSAPNGITGPLEYHLEGDRRAGEISGSVTGVIFECFDPEIDYTGLFTMTKE